MKLLTRRAGALLFLALAMVFGIVVFTTEYVREGPSWVQHSHNKHLYEQGKTAVSGTIYDRNGEILFSLQDGRESYHQEKSVRTAMLHTVGDGWGNISTSVQVQFRQSLSGWDFVNGAYRFKKSSPGMGSDLTLSLDAELCKTAYEALRGRKGTVGVYNYKTGEILCMVSSPSFDPTNRPDLEGDSERYEGVYMNRFLSATYTPGSVFKLVTAAAALEKVEGIESQRFSCDGKKEIGGVLVTCQEAHGDMDLKGALAVSCNIAFAEITEQVGAKNLQKYADKTGMNEALSVSGIPTAAGSVDVRKAEGADLAWAGIGQYTDMVNPLNFMAYMGAIANEGVRVSPRIFKVPDEGVASLLPDLKRKQDRVLSEETADKIKVLMRNDVVEGYGEEKFKGLELCAKTGTAEVGENLAPHAWFAGFLDREDTPYAFVVVVENGNSGISAAAPVAAKVLSFAVEN